MSVIDASAAGQTAATKSSTSNRNSRSSEPRVRELVREAVALMVFSAGVSVTMALALLIAYGIGR